MPWLLLSAVIVAAVIAYVLTAPVRAPVVTPSQFIAPTVGYRVVGEFPHDPEAFTQGLIYLDGFLYESTGPKRRSSRSAAST